MTFAIFHDDIELTQYGHIVADSLHIARREAADRILDYENNKDYSCMLAHNGRIELFCKGEWRNYVTVEPVAD